MATVSTLPMRNLISRIGGVTGADILAIRDDVIKAAEKLRESIAPAPTAFGALFDTEYSERKEQQKNLTEAINKLKSSKTTEDIKKNLLYLQATIEVSKAFYGKNERYSRAFSTFMSDISKASAMVTEPLGKVSLTVMKNLWPVLLGVGIVLGVIVIARKYV